MCFAFNITADLSNNALHITKAVVAVAESRVTPMQQIEFHRVQNAEVSIQQ